MILVDGLFYKASKSMLFDFLKAKVYSANT